MFSGMWVGGDVNHKIPHALWRKQQQQERKRKNLDKFRMNWEENNNRNKRKKLYRWHSHPSYPRLLLTNRAWRLLSSFIFYIKTLSAFASPLLLVSISCLLTLSSRWTLLAAVAKVQGNRKTYHQINRSFIWSQSSLYENQLFITTTTILIF